MNLNIRNMVIWPVPSVRSDSEGTVQRITSRKTSILRQTHAPISSKLQYPPGKLLASYAGDFRGVRISSLPTNACSTQNNIPFPLLHSFGK